MNQKTREQTDSCKRVVLYYTNFVNLLSHCMHFYKSCFLFHICIAILERGQQKRLLLIISPSASASAHRGSG